MKYVRLRCQTFDISQILLDLGGLERPEAWLPQDNNRHEERRRRGLFECRENRLLSPEERDRDVGVE